MTSSKVVGLSDNVKHGIELLRKRKEAFLVYKQMPFEDACSLMDFLASVELSVIPCNEGKYSLVALQTEMQLKNDPMEAHVDGFYLEEIPRFCVLYCMEPGTKGLKTILYDNHAALEQLPTNVVDTLKLFDMIFFHHSGKVFERPLVEEHQSGEKSINLVGKGSISPSRDRCTLAQIPTVAQQVQIFGDMYHALDRSPLYSHTWKKGDLLIFNNRAITHGRERILGDKRGLYDPERALFRVWGS